MTTVGDTIICVLLSFLALCITIINAFVIYLVSKRRSLRNPTNICLSSLAASDLMAGTIAIPLIIACSLTAMEFNGTCLASDLISRFISISTALHLLVVTIERYIMIVHGMKYKIWINTRRVVVVLVVTWVYSAVVTIIQLTWQLTQTQEASYKTDTIYDFICFGAMVVVPLIIMAASYVRIFIALRYQLKVIQRYNNPVEKNTELRKRRMERKAAIIFGCMILMFILCWFSYFLDGIRSGLDSDSFAYPKEVGMVLMFLRYASPLVNPLLYTFLKEDFKQAAKMIFCKRNRNGSRTSYVYATQYIPSSGSPETLKEAPNPN